MKYYKLVKDLPTFKAGELFFISSGGSLVNVQRSVVAYSVTTLEKFPNILEDWFEEDPEPERDEGTKRAFIEYLHKHKDERFFQAVRNFASEYLGDDFSFIYISKRPLENYLQHYDKFYDTFYLECDILHEVKEEDDEEQRASEY